MRPRRSRARTPARSFSTRTGDTTQPLVVTYGIAGSATNGSDYEQLFGSVTIPAGSATASVAINPIDDAIAEPSETVVLNVLAGDTYAAAAGTASVTIADNDSTSAFGAKINFQPSAPAAPSGYVPDGGQTYAARNGLSYGWSSDNASWTRDRNLNPDQRYDTLTHFQGKTWELGRAERHVQRARGRRRRGVLRQRLQDRRRGRARRSTARRPVAAGSSKASRS
jgi:hypothetical protein